MKPERWQQVKLAMTQALQVSHGERARFLEEHCGSDVALRVEVESLLAEVRSEDADSGDADDSLRALVLSEARALSKSRSANDVETLRATLQQNLGDSYDIVSTLGVGGMGAVFLARERALDRYVAIKTLRAEQAVTAGSRERFRREARIAAGLSHPGILPLYAFGETGGMWYLVMGYVRGQSLAQRLQTEGRIAPEDAWRILRALTDALIHAHGRQIIHRDIKPANILIDSEGSRPLLADFGISRVIGDTDALTKTGDMLGTPHFMSPEQIINAHECTERSDIYALGAVAYAMLSGRAPLAEISSGDLLARRSASTVVPLERLCPTVAPDFCAVVMRCLASRPEDRWPSAKALRDALDRVDQTVDAPLPAAVRELTGFGAYAVVWFLFWMAWLSRADSSGKQAIIVLLALLVPLALIMHVARVSSPSQRRSQLWQVAFWPPLWWGVWWPVFLRRPDDVWKHLPGPAKMIRTVMTAFVIALPILAFDHGLLGGVRLADGVKGWYVAAGLTLLMTAFALTGTFLWSIRLNLSRIDTVHFLLGPTAPSSFWKRRDIARLLRVDRLRVRAPEAEIPADYVRAFEELRRVSSPEIAGVVELSTTFARHATRVIAKLDSEIALLERDASPAERARLGARLSGLRQNTPSGALAQSHQALIAIVESEVALMIALDERRLLAQNESKELFTVIKTMWTEIQKLSDGVGASSEPATSMARLLQRGDALLARHRESAVTG